MSEAPDNSSAGDDFRPEYDFRKLRGVARGKYAGKFREGRTVRLAKDLEEAFPDEATVDGALREYLRITSDRSQELVRSYLRLNGYFIIPNFIIHAADDPNRVVDDTIGNYTEIDLLGVRMPYSAEQTAHLRIANDPPLVSGADGKFDIVVAEVKSGAKNRPNAAWRPNANPYPLEYLLRFVGLFSHSDEIKRAAESLGKSYRYETTDCRLRYLIFAPEPNTHYQGLGVEYITFREIARFLVEVRGQCWIESNLGVASSHPQWNSLLVQMFKIANDVDTPPDQRIDRILESISRG